MTFVALLLSILFFLKQRNRKDISYRVILDTPLLSIRKEVEGRILYTMLSPIVKTKIDHR